MFAFRIAGVPWLLATVVVAAAGRNTATAQAPASGHADKPAVNEVDEFALPAGGTKELLEFIERISQREFNARTEQENLALLRKGAAAMAAAAERVLSEKGLSEADRVKAATYQLQSLAILAQLNDKQSQQRLRKLAQAAKADSDKKLAAKGRFHLVQALLREAEAGDATQLPALLGETRIMLAESPANVDLIRNGLSIAGAFEAMGEYRAALDVFAALKEAAVRSSQPPLMEAVEELGGVAKKRLSSVGKSLQLEGTTVDGNAFDWSEYKGKVVLVDFWATWCGICVAEMPNIKANYEKWHAKGFEVVGVNLDKERGDLERFLNEEKLPWVTLFSDNLKQNNALAEKYGVHGLPQTMLVGRDGKVITLKVRGEELGTRLQQLLGDGEKSEAPNPKSETNPKSQAPNKDR